MEKIRFTADGSVCMVWDESGPVRCPTQEDMDELPVGEDMATSDVSMLDD